MKYTKLEVYPDWHPMAQQDGITLRDYFAAKAMQSVLLSDRYPGVFGVNRYETVTAILAYKMADAMLEARNAAQ
jgi:hypothetical protein